VHALYVVGSNPIRRYGFDLAPSKTFLVVQDLFLTETASMADVVLPATCAYEKSGTITNTCGDLQRITKAGDVAGPKSDLEIIAHLAQRMGYDVAGLSGRGEWLRADLGQSRGVQSGEADRHAVWLREQGLEPQLGGFNPRAVLDEIQELFPNYRLGHASLASAETKSGENFRAHAADGMILPSNDDLFSSGTLGRIRECSVKCWSTTCTFPTTRTRYGAARVGFYATRCRPYAVTKVHRHCGATPSTRNMRLFAARCLIGLIAW
jgi:NADH-quinone oxidoreductase subunit G